MMKQSPITPLHEKLGARMGKVEGWTMPQGYTDLVDEHLAVRSSCGVFDTSHLSKFRVQGVGALAWLESTFSCSVASMEDGAARPALLLNRLGVIVDHVLLARRTAEQFFIVGSASQEQVVEARLHAHLPLRGVELFNDTEQWCALSVQGPDAPLIYARTLPGEDYPATYTFRPYSRWGSACYVAGAVPTLSDGFVLYCRADAGIRWFEGFMAAGAIPCGAETGECLRLESGRRSVAQDAAGLSPAMAGLQHLCVPGKEYLGSNAALRTKNAPQQLVQLTCAPTNTAPAVGALVLDAQNRKVGSITSSCLSPALHRGLAIALVDSSSAAPGTELQVLINHIAIPAKVEKSTSCDFRETC